jgi:hypothetical protein
VPVARLRLWLICGWLALDGCASTPHVEARLGPLDRHQSDVLRGCHLVVGFVSKITALRDQGLSRDAILQSFREKGGEKAVAAAAHILPTIEADAPAPGTVLDYAAARFRRCVAPVLPDTGQQDAATFCYRLSQFADLALAYRGRGEPMDRAYTNWTVAPDVKPITDSLLQRLEATPDEQDGVEIPVDAYLECAGLATK